MAKPKTIFPYEAAILLKCTGPEAENILKTAGIKPKQAKAGMQHRFVRTEVERVADERRMAQYKASQEVRK